MPPMPVARGSPRKLPGVLCASRTRPSWHPECGPGFICSDGPQTVRRRVLCRHSRRRRAGGQGLPEAAWPEAGVARSPDRQKPRRQKPGLPEAGVARSRGRKKQGLPEAASPETGVARSRVARNRGCQKPRREKPGLPEATSPEAGAAKSRRPGENHRPSVSSARATCGGVEAAQIVQPFSGHCTGCIAAMPLAAPKERRVTRLKIWPPGWRCG